MDTDFLMYQITKDLWKVLLADWKSDVVTLKYWGVVTFIVIAYAIWYRLTDKRRLADLLLFGSLLAVMRMIIDEYAVTAGLWYYRVRILPLPPSIFLYNLTITPLTVMLAQQYSSNWKQFFMWSAVACAFIYFGILPIFVKINLVVFMHWNYFYGFTVMYIATILSRAAFHLIIQVQAKARAGKPSPLQSTLMQPAFKPGGEKEDPES